MFSFEELNSIKSIRKRILYCKEHLTRLAAGSSRIVYKLNDTQVLKLAKNPYGVVQCYEENAIYNNVRYLDCEYLFSPVSKPHPMGYYHVMEIAPKATKEDFPGILGCTFGDISSFAQICDFQIERHSKKNKGMTIMGVLVKYSDFYHKFNNNELEGKLQEYLNDLQFCIYNLPLKASDFTKLDSWGRTPNNELKLVDYGFTEVTAKMYATKIVPILDPYEALQYII